MDAHLTTQDRSLTSSPETPRTGPAPVGSQSNKPAATETPATISPSDATTPETGTADTATTPYLTLEILTGKTQFPTRPVLKERYLIGSDARCDLRLGGDRVPLIHSVVVIGLDEILLERIAPAPSLIVNGQLVHGTVLRDGDLIRIGGVEIKAHVPARTARELPVPLLAPVSTELTEAELTGVDPNLSADELVDLIAEALGESDKYRVRLEAGAEALLDEIRRKGARGTKTRVDKAAAGPGAPHWNTARIPLERVLAAATEQSNSQAELLRKIDALEEEVSRVTNQLRTLEVSREAGTFRAKTRAGELRRAKASLLAEINQLFDRIEQPPNPATPSRRASA